MPAPVRLACLLALSVLLSPPARAEEVELSPREQADALLRDGARFGEQGKWDDAIRRFRAAESKFPRAVHDCNIGLAYIRSTRPHLALHYLRRCEARATEPVPGWVETRRTEALEALRKGAFTPVEVAVSPLGATFTVDTLPGETFAPVGTGGALATLSLWLPEGRHTLRLTAPGHQAETRSIEASGRAALRLEATLSPAPVALQTQVEEGDAATPPLAATGASRADAQGPEASSGSSSVAEPDAVPPPDRVPSPTTAPAARVCHPALQPGDGPDQYPGCLGERGPSWLAITGWTGVGLGVALGGVTLYAFLEGKAADRAGDEARFNALKRINNPLFVASIGMGAAGLTCLILDALSDDLDAPRPVSVGVAPVAGGGVLAAAGRF
jgi:hypothetical protein